MTILSKAYPMDLTTGSIEQVRQSAPKIDNELTAIYGHLNNIRTRYRGATAPTNPEAGQQWEDTVNAVVKKWNGSAWEEETASSTNLTNRNTVLQGQVSSAGALELILGSTSALTADLVSSALTTIIAIPAGHDDVMGNADYIVSFSATQTAFWSSLPANNTSHLFVDYSSGTVTGVYSVIAPVYQSYAPAHSAGKNWYDTNKEQWYLSDGSNWVAKYRCYVGSVVTDGSKVTSTVIEPYNVIRSAVPMTYIDTDTTLAANSDAKIATQKAVKAYADSKGVLAGAILQIKQTVKTSSFSSNSASFVDVTGLSVAITPASASNKILILLNSYLSQTAQNAAAMNLLRDSTLLLQGDEDGSVKRSTAAGLMDGGIRLNAVSIAYLDSPNTTSEVTYKAQVAIGNNGVVWVNRTAAGNANVDYSAVVSTITVMEVKG